MCELDWSRSAEGHESCENGKKQFDIVKDIKILG